MSHPIRLLRPVTLAAACLLAGAGSLPLAWAQPSAQAQAVDIPSLPAAQALQRFVEATKFQLLYAPEVVRGVTTKPVSGTLTPREVLARMLDGTGVQIVDTGLGAATLRPTAAAAAPRPVSEAAAAQAIMVTARKASERAQDVPIAVTAITGEGLRRRGASSVTEVLQDAPGVSSYDRGSGGPKIAIRGISTSLGANENGYYLDDLPFTGVSVPIAPDVRAWDLERVEILRGPQGTLFGEGSMGGTVRILTNNARLGEFGFAGQLGGARTSGGGNNSSAKAMVNVPLGERLAVRVAATHEELAGWIDDAATGAQNVNTSRIDTARVRVRWDATDRLTLNATWWSFDGRYPKGGSNATDQGTLPNTVLSNSSKYELAGVSATYDFDAASLFYSYSRSSLALPQSGSLFGGTLVSTIDIDVAAHELRVASNGKSALRWTAGLYQRESRRDDKFEFALFGLNDIGRVDSTARAVFAEASYSLPGLPLELTAGVRRFQDRLQSAESSSGVARPPADNTFKSTNPRFSVAWKAAPDWQVYTSASKGFRSGQNQPGASVALAGPLGISLPAALKPDSIWTYELGTKAVLLDKRMTVEATVYHSDWKDVTVRIPIGTTGFNGLINSGGTKTGGVEASVALDVSPALTFTLAGSYTDASYAADVPGTGIAKGKSVDEISKLTLSGSAEYRFAAFGDWQGRARLGYQYHSKREFPSFPLYQAGDAINNVHARISFERAGWTLSLFGENLTNDNGAVTFRSVQPLGPGVNDVSSTRLRPRTLGLELRYALGR
jgi:outer membrane receptor protein involved in Fe transport